MTTTSQNVPAALGETRRRSPIAALLGADLRNISRDSLLKFLLVYPLVIGLVLRWLIPFAQRGLVELYDIEPLYPLLVSFFGILIVPMLSGVVIGFLLLDERDVDTLTAIMVTPLPMTNYLAYRLTVPMVVGVLATLVIVPMIGVMAVPLWVLFVMGLGCSVLAPLVTLILVLIASNKVQGLALMKGISLFLTGPFIAWFVPVPWQYLFGIFPSYWPLKAFWVWAEGGVWWPWLLAGVAYSAVLVALLLVRFRKGLYKTS
jgi:fluoroquinolone transport system permease protein